MDLKIIAEKVDKVIFKNNLTLFSVKIKQEHNLKILEILLDGNLNSDNIELIHNAILETIYDDLPDDYYLEVSSAGAERPIRNATEMFQYIGSYIYISSDYYAGNGELIAFDGEAITITVNDKGRSKKLVIPYEKINEARLAVKF